MNISSISAAVGSPMAPAVTPHSTFADAVKSVAGADAGQQQLHAVKTVVGQTPAQASTAHVLDSVSQAQKRMDAVLKMAESGHSFTAAELLALQTRVYRANQELDLAGKVVEKATGGVKQVLQTQV